LPINLKNNNFFFKGQGAPWEVKEHKGTPWCQKGESILRIAAFFISHHLGAVIPTSAWRRGVHTRDILLALA
jgi:hypothetical protein